MDFDLSVTAEICRGVASLGKTEEEKIEKVKKMNMFFEYTNYYVYPKYHHFMKLKNHAARINNYLKPLFV